MYACALQAEAGNTAATKSKKAKPAPGAASLTGVRAYLETTVVPLLMTALQVSIVSFTHASKLFIDGVRPAGELLTCLCVRHQSSTVEDERGGGGGVATHKHYSTW